MTRRAWGLAVGVVAVAAIAIFAVLVFGHGKGARTIDWDAVPHLQTQPAPWSNGSRDLPSRLDASGLHALTMEGAAMHIHQHLDIYVNGRHVTVPALVGIDPFAGFLTEIHTHDASGILHVESPVQEQFTLGQFFCEWGVKLTANCLGRYHGRVSLWVNGRKLHGDPAQLVLEQHQEIVVAVGGAPAHVPTAYSFPAGL